MFARSQSFATVVITASTLASCSPPTAADIDATDIDLRWPERARPKPRRDASPTPAPPRVILFIGDGMGPVHEQVASQFAHGAPDSLSWHQWPTRGQLVTDSLGGVTDSAASATAMATGYLTFNGRVAIDGDGIERETLVELAKSRGMATGVVTTAALPHATPAAFTAHQLDRNDLRACAEDQARETQPSVLFGGGLIYYAAFNGQSNLFGELSAAGYETVFSAAALDALDTTISDAVVGSFAFVHFPYAENRGPGFPSLEAMTSTAIEILERDEDGFFLVVEGARIDHAAHAGDIANAVGETLELDRAVDVVTRWAETRDNVTIIVTADHETGALSVEAITAAGAPPQVSWGSPDHTGAPVNIYGRGAGAEGLDGIVGDPRVIHGALRAALTTPR